MHDWVSFNNNIVQSSDVRIEAVSNAGLYGAGVFTTIRIRDGLPFLFDKHWRRLEGDAAKLGIGLGHLTKEALFSSLMELVDHNAAEDGKCRVTVFDCAEPSLWSGGGGGSGSEVLILTSDSEKKIAALSSGVSPFPVASRSPLNNIKSCNYLERILARQNASDAGFDEALRINEKGEVVSVCMANVFWLKGERLFTPSLETGCLEGTTRAYVMERWKAVPVNAAIETLLGADSVFITSAAWGIAEVGEIFFDNECVKYKKLEKERFTEYNLERLV